MTRPTLFTHANDSFDTEFRGLINKSNQDGETCFDALTRFGPEFAQSIMLSAARMIYRTYNVNQIPHFFGVLWSEAYDEYGNNTMVEVQYDKIGHRAVYGGKLTRNDGFIWQCYMD